MSKCPLTAAQIDRAARLLYEWDQGGVWSHLTEGERDWYRKAVKVVITAMKGGAQ